RDHRALRPTELQGVPGDGLENRLLVTRRRRDEAQDLRGRRLLLTRCRELVRRLPGRGRARRLPHRLFVDSAAPPAGHRALPRTMEARDRVSTLTAAPLR